MNEDGGINKIVTEVAIIKSDVEYIKKALDNLEKIPENISNLQYIIKGANGSDGLTRKMETICEEVESLKKKVSEFEEFKKRLYWIMGILIAVSGGIGGFASKLFELFK